LPFSPFFAKVEPTRQVPSRATILTSAFCILYGLIYIGSSVAFTSFISTAILSLNLTYTIPQTIVLIRGRSNVLPTRHFDLGAVFGPFCNAFATCWTSLYVVLFCFPIFLPVTVETMNYVSVVMAGTAVFVAAMWWLPRQWGGKRGVFEGPRVGEGGLELLSAVNAGGVGAVRMGSLGRGEAGVAGKVVGSSAEEKSA
jgi:choline transport protein